MSDVKEQAPAVGKGSPVGKRWFITGCPEATYTVTPSDTIIGEGGKERRQKPVYIRFIKQLRPAVFQGEGMLGTQNVTGTDRNDNPYWGVFCADPNKPGEKGKQDAAFIDFLRDHAHYLRQQDNKATNVQKLQIKELSWDPRDLEVGAGQGLIARGRSSLTKPEASTPAPVQKTAEPRKARVADMSGAGEKKD